MPNNCDSIIGQSYCPTEILFKLLLDALVLTLGAPVSRVPALADGVFKAA